MTKDKNNVQEELAADGGKAGVELEEYAPYPFDAEKISITDKRVPMETVIRRLKQKTISAPEIQRGEGLWGDDQQSRLIESLMLKIPVPLFYVAEDENVSWKVVDGLQRITAIRRYVLNHEFKLVGLEFMRELEGKTFEQLPNKFQTRILETEFQFAIINPSTPQNVQRNVFKRLNTGGLPLTAQEIRHALYYGPSALLLKEMAESKEFIKATTGSVNDSRMVGRELVLRFLAFLIRGVKSYPKNEDMDAFLSETMQLINIMPDLPKKEINKIVKSENYLIKYNDHNQLKEFFKIAMSRAHKLFGSYAFRKALPGQNRYRTPINKSLFETWSVLLCEMDVDIFNKLIKNKNRLFALAEASTYLAGNDDLSRFISRDSHKYVGVQTRYKIIDKIIKASLTDSNIEDMKYIIGHSRRLDDSLETINNQTKLKKEIQELKGIRDDN
ncbi:hypothetical protein DSCO28_70210 [Desulfosarcina ovata subsp. sediminis]|uniref:GmrSD restriction endonucleases N-terminal domain-containing protein n=1 Tax=Desulfosarcina ovata subsp. sediminis TaxID=885957 RepID=A0A5K8A1J6_9BACT|nr:DUF262 domain-containing protein [Desulfosarcina ovata]BBO86455.1 hypothetical protein DSCO28_70210 [Desulfosarcina ovata subsp. sediminis]